MNNSECLYCGKELKGRLDKKFCDAYCRNTYNNETKRPHEQFIREVNMITRRNRRILRHLCPQGKAVVRKEVLDQLKYDYRFFSGIHRTRSAIYYLCYDYGFAPFVENGVERATIIQRQEYMDKTNPWK